MSGWIGVDLDGTLAHYEGWVDELHIGEPVPRMQARVKAWLAKGTEVKIFTARVAPVKNLDGSDRDVEVVRTAIQDWCEKHVGQRLEVTNAKDYGMVELWDDRAVQVVPNMGLTYDGRE